MAGPLITAARNRIRRNHPIAAAAVDVARDIVADPSTSATVADGPAIAAAVENRVGPILDNATNQEPWWKSRIWVGLITTGVGLLLTRLDIQLTTAERTFLDQLLPYLPAGVGMAIAAVGRAVGSRKGPIDWRRPWTIFGIGR